MSKFEDSLWADMQREHGQSLLQSMAKHRSRRTARWIGAAAAVAVLGTGALAASTYFGGAPPAYAVVDNPDGSVTLTVREFGRFKEATEKLREHGISAMVVPVLPDCADKRPQVDPPRRGLIPFKDVRQVNGEATLTIVPEAILPNSVLAIGTVNEGNGRFGTLVMGMYSRGQGPTCLQYNPPSPGPLPTISR
ncbi:hypothetical protein SAMN04488074_12662 [Lentzea albidocapillata subsp. violacea]|uniref:Uncharacterized protein n=1 Tax=Lentzea albidocapillata subsp. violacea TaxID=128104 RepID=A0A1G9VT50_9PSEU|nr:hypothetical protein [Lentzea albidocapillata]SDM75409.1 hypothetical protein SAMN04488074_12662 [Lentzea albidocapillata subsp. violacea]